MSGETERDISAWTVDSLRTHLLGLIQEKDERIVERDRRYEQRFESQEKAISTAMTAYGTAVELAAARYNDEIKAVRERFDLLLAERDMRYGERFEASQVAIQAALVEREKAIQAALLEREKAVKAAFDAQETAVQLALAGIRSFYDTVLQERDQRYEARFTSGEKAVVIALATADKEFQERIRQVRDETILAMAAAEKAIVKAEMATEKRFESVNEFRAQQADVIATFARKTEIDTRLVSLAEKVDGYHEQLNLLTNNSMPRVEYDRSHTDLVQRVTQVEKIFAEKLEAQTKGLEARITTLQAQLSSVQAITG
jgi:hypothetical protein